MNTHVTLRENSLKRKGLTKSGKGPYVARLCYSKTFVAIVQWEQGECLFSGDKKVDCRKSQQMNFTLSWSYVAFASFTKVLLAQYFVLIPATVSKSGSDCI